MTPLLVLPLLPWLGLLAFVLLAVRVPSSLPRIEGPPEGGPPGPPGASTATEGRGRASRELPLVSVIVPARNEAATIEACVASLTASDYPSFEVIVVDDQSDDGTGDLARAVGPGRARRLRVMEGAPPPGGWLGKQWACWQGQAEAEGEILLFIDADTVHGADLLGRAVAELRARDADLLTVAGRQLYGSFWERLVQPQVFFTMILRYWNLERWVERGRWRDAIASGAFLMLPRASYQELGGHEAVRGAVAEDLALAQRTVRSGGRLVLRLCEDALWLRMYTSLGELVRGWGKNIHIGGLETMPPWIRPLVPPASVASGVGLWVAPPLALLAGSAGLLGPGWTLWAGGAVLASLALWVPVYHRAGAPAIYGILYPLGAAVGVWIYLRSWRAGRNVAWKGRTYQVAGEGE